MWDSIKQFIGEMSVVLETNVFTFLLLGFLILCFLWILVKLIYFIVNTLFVSSFMLIMCFVALFFVGGLAIVVSSVAFGLYQLYKNNEDLAIGGCIIFGLLLCITSGFAGYKWLKEIKEMSDNEQK